MPMDAYRQGGRFVIQLDGAGVDAGPVELTVEKNVLTPSDPGPSARRLAPRTRSGR